MKTTLLAALCAAVMLLSSAQAFSIGKKVSEDQMTQKEMFNSVDSGESQDIKYTQIAPSSKVDYVGQVGGLDTDQNGNLIIFHRGSRVWDGTSYIGNKFNLAKYPKAIAENILDVIDPATFKNVGSWGKGRFYMPHGLTLDNEGNLWFTDVATHQVFKYNFEVSDEPLLSLGVRFEDGSDENHFCKPTGVAVSARNGDIFVSDGYCNQRVAQFDKNGQYIKEFQDRSAPLNIAHSVALVEKLGLVCTVSREEGRLVCFDVASGDKKHEITHPAMTSLYAIKYDVINEQLVAVSGSVPAVAFRFKATQAHFGDLVSMWQDKEGAHVHDMALSPDANTVYMGHLNGEVNEFRFD